MGHYEKALRQELAQKYPSPSSAQPARLEKEIQKDIGKYEKTPEPRHDRTQERGMSTGFCTLKKQKCWIRLILNSSYLPYSP